MKIGVRAHDYGKHEVEVVADILKKEGYEAAQIAIPRSFTGVENFADINEELLFRINNAFVERNIEISVLSCYQDLGNPNEEIRRTAVEAFKKCLYYSKLVGARLVGSETSYAHLSKLEKHVWFPYMMDSLKRLAEEAEKQNVWMAIEPVAWHPLEDIETTREVLDALNSKHVKVIFDLANVLERPTEMNQSAYWKKCFSLIGDDIEAIHLKDFIIGENGEYIPKLLGEGIMDYHVLAEWLKTHPDIPVLREEMDPATAAADLAFMRKLV